MVGAPTLERKSVDSLSVMQTGSYGSYGTRMMHRPIQPHASKRSASPTGSPARTPNESRRGGAQPRPILIVDDDEDIRDAVRTILEDEGYSTLEASEGREALSMLERPGMRPSMLLLDLMMPTMDGWQLRARLRENPALASIPIVIMTAHAAFLRAVANATPDTPVLPKPIDIERLLELVATYSA